MTARKSKTPGSEKDGFSYDLEEAIKYLSPVDPTLANVIERVGPFNMQIRRMHSPFEALARNIIYQQLHDNAAGAIHQLPLAHL
jgi:3-methyladenine DNA glycosylase/8-oxoguanine DNA glycosylase